jgi:hypothetical protein
LKSTLDKILNKFYLKEIKMALKYFLIYATEPEGACIINSILVKRNQETNKLYFVDCNGLTWTGVKLFEGRVYFCLNY